MTECADNHATRVYHACHDNKGKDANQGEPSSSMPSSSLNTHLHDTHGQEEEESSLPLVHQMLVYSWGGAIDGNNSSLLNVRGNDTMHPLVWGGISYHVAPLVQQVRAWREFSMLPFLMGWLLILDPPEIWKQALGDKVAVFLALAIACWGCVWNECLMHRFKHRVAAVIQQDVTQAIEPLGYRVVYRTQPTGICYTKEHYMCVYALNHLQTAQDRSTAQLLALASRVQLEDNRYPLDTEIVVYLYGTPFQHLVSWHCNWSRPMFISDDCPIPDLPICLWGALQDAFRVPRLDMLPRRSMASVEIWLFVLIYGTVRGANWAFMILFTAPVFFLIAVVSLSWLSTISRNVGHIQWQQAAHEWADAVATCGWQMEYHHDSLQAAFCTSPAFWLRFVRVRNNNV